MIMMPPAELIKYISRDENEQWIHSEDMPEELVEMFNKFIVDEQKAKEYKRKFGK